MNNKKIKSASFLTKSALIAAIYVVLTWLSALFGLSGGAVQLRLSEMLSVLPIFTPAAIPGLFVGCILSNIFTGAVIWDVIFGSLATLLGACGAFLLRKRSVWVAALPNILTNSIIVPIVLRYAYGAEGSLVFLILTVFLGELLSSGVLGIFFANTLKKHKIEL